MQRLIELAVALVAALAPARRALSERRRGFRPGWLRAIALCTLFAFSACSMSATLTRRDGWYYEGTIEGSDAEYFYLRTYSGSVEKVRRADIADIDHPGNVLGTMGILGGAASGILLGLFLTDICDAHIHHGPQSFVSIGVSAFSLGLAAMLAVSGWGDYFHSRKAANHFDRAPVVPIGISPVLTPNLAPPSTPPASPQPPSLDASPSSASVPYAPGARPPSELLPPSLP